MPLAEVERQAITDALDLLDNNVEKAAGAPRFGRSTLYRELKKCGLPPDS